MKALAQQLVNRPLARTFLLFFAFLVITATLNMFWRTSSRKSAKVGFEGVDGTRETRDKLATAHFMVGTNGVPHDLVSTKGLSRSLATRIHIPKPIGRRILKQQRKRACTYYRHCRR